MPPGESEPPSDYLSRLSFRNARDGINRLCVDFGIDPFAVSRGDATALDEVAVLSGCDPDSLGVHAFKLLPKEKMAYRGQILTKASAPLAHVWICSACAEEDLGRWSFREEARLHRRGEWCLASIRTCAKHHQSLVRIGEINSATPKDTSSVMAPFATNLSAVRRRSVERAPSALESYVLARLDGTCRSTWLDAMPLYAAVQVCSMLGLVELHGASGRFSSLLDDGRRDCGAAGFAIASKGEYEIRNLLDRMQVAFRCPGSEWGPMRILGPLYKWLANPRLDDAFAPLVGVVRRHCVETLAIGAGETILGLTVSTRRVHSLNSASKEYGISKPTLRSILRAEGLVTPATDELPPYKVTFDASVAEPILRDACDTLNLEQTMEYLGVPTNSERAFLASALLPPWNPAGKGRLKDHVFRRRDVVAFAAKLRSHGRSRLKEDPALTDLPTTARLTQSTSVFIASLMLEGRLRRVAVRSGHPAWMSMLVDASEIRPLLRDPKSDYMSLRELSKLVGVDSRVVSALIRVGAMRSQIVAHPTQKRPTLFVSREELAKFQATYVKLGVLANELGSVGWKVRAKLSETGIEPAFDYEDIGVFLYRREDVALFAGAR
ncbi:hypothetical protein ASG43_17440 [Aureimonas sp. Leaf454]|nr:hypothetical protein ASG43_17440 [Aureimonas sp. Leaf454]